MHVGVLLTDSKASILPFITSLPAATERALAWADSCFQLTTDGLQAYVPAVDEMPGDRCDYAQLIKFYSQPREGEQRYSPAEIVEAVPVVISGNPDPARICTSHVDYARACLL